MARFRILLPNGLVYSLFFDPEDRWVGATPAYLANLALFLNLFIVTTSETMAQAVTMPQPWMEEAIAFTCGDVPPAFSRSLVMILICSSTRVSLPMRLMILLAKRVLFSDTLCVFVKSFV